MRTKTPRAAKAPSLPPPPHVIDPRAIYWVDTLQATLRLRKSSVRREWKAGRLRVGKRCGRLFVLGNWLREWLLQGELRRPEP